MNTLSPTVDNNINIETISSNKDRVNHILDVIFDYTANGDDELTLRRGTKLEVLSTDESISGSQGWWTGRLVDSDSVGVFPANFVTDCQTNLRIINYNDLYIGETIGVGGFGHVYRGKFGDVDVAIKTAKSLASFCSIQTNTTPSNKLTGDETSEAVQKALIDGLLREARLFSHLKHRNIIQLFGVSPCLSSRTLYLVMEYANGGALSSLLQRRKSGLYPTVLIQYAKQIADGMNYLHEEACEHIIHRDLKCSNILILESIDDVFNDDQLLVKTLKITDFGLARKQFQSSTMTAAGTFAWMSPECIRNNEFSTKSDVWSFGVLLWECLTGELPYQDFDQMQVAFGIATNKYSLPIPSTCPEEFSQLMKNCWKISPQDRPTFNDLLTQIDQIIPKDIRPIEFPDEFYQSLQEDWRQEIQEMFEELKEKEQEIRDREQAIIQLSLEQNHQRVQLAQWAQHLHEREMHLVECELKLLMTTMNQERLQHQTPKVQKRSGRFMRSFLNSTPSLSSPMSNYISQPTNFRHLISVCHNHPTNEYNLSSPVANVSTSTNSIRPNSPIKTGHVQQQDSFSSSSTPTTPNLNRLRTLTFHFPVHTDGSNSSTPLEKSIRSSSSTRSLTHRIHARKSKSTSSSTKRFSCKNKQSNGEAKWYLEHFSPINTNNNNNNDSCTSSSTKSTPILDRPSKKLSLSSSSCSTPNDRSLARALFDINSMLTGVILGRRLPISFDSISSSSHSFLTNETTKIEKSKSTTTKTPSPPTIEASRFRTSLSPLPTNESDNSIGFNSVKYRSRHYSSPMRPNSLVLASCKYDSSCSSSQRTSTNVNQETSDQLKHLVEDETESFHSAQSSNLPTPLIQSMNFHSPWESCETSFISIMPDEDRKKIHLVNSIEQNNNSH